MRVTSIGHAVFAATLIAVGVMGVLTRDFTVVWQPVATNIPARELLVYLCAFISLACGIGLLWPRSAAAAARVLLAYLVFWFLAFSVPGFFRSLGVDVYWAASKTAVLVSAAWVLYVRLADDWDRRRFGVASGATGLRLAQALYGLAIIPFGIAHLQYIAHTASLVPTWLPARVGWAYFTGGAFIAAGLAVLVGVYARLAAALSALMMGLFLLLVWVPAAMHGTLNEFQWGETRITWVLAAAAWVVAESYRGIRWFATGRRRPAMAEPSR